MYNTESDIIASNLIEPVPQHPRWTEIAKQELAQ